MTKKQLAEQRKKMIDVANLLRENRQDIYELWMQQQANSNLLRLDLMSKDNFELQSKQFIDAFFDALSTGNVDDIEGEEYQVVRNLLIDISRSRAVQGFSPSETATFVFSLKDSCMHFIQREFKDDVDTLLISLTGISQAIEKLGLQTFEAFTLAREEMAREQADTILSMATPVATIWDKVLLLPVVGTIDSKRAQSIMETMLEKILQMGAKVIVLDVMGVITIDSAVAQHLLKISQATDLMGCRCIITGISPQIAQAIVQLGLDLGDVTTTATLKDGLEEALTYIHLKVVDSRA